LSLVRISVSAVVSMNLVSAWMSYIAAGNFEDKVCLFSRDQLVPLGAIVHNAAAC